MILAYLAAFSLAFVPSGGGMAGPQQGATEPAGSNSSAPARATANLASYLSDSDYPIEAIRKREQGTVRFRLEINAEGRVIRCILLESSGSAALDDTTCRVMTERTRFRPAHDAQGRPMPDSMESRIRWVLPADDLIEPVPAIRATSLVALESLARPEDYPAEAVRRGEQGMVGVNLLISPTGKVEACRVEHSNASAALDAASCALISERARFKPARDANGNPAYDALATSIDWKLPASRK